MDFKYLILAFAAVLMSVIATAHEATPRRTTILKATEMEKPALSRTSDCHVTFAFEGDKSSWMPDQIIILGEDDFCEAIFLSVMSPETDLPAGKYDFIAKFINLYDETFTEPYQAVVIRENVEVEGDVSLSFSSDEATHRISFRALLPDGQNMELPVLTEEGIPDNSESNVAEILIGTDIVCVDNGSSVGGFQTQAFFQDADGRSEYQRGDYFVNDFSDRYFLRQTVLANADYDTYVVGLVAKNPETSVISNNPESYFTYEEPFVKTPLFDTHGCEFHSSSVTVATLAHNVRRSTWRTVMAHENPVVHIGGDAVVDSDDHMFDILVYPGSLDMDKWEEYTYFENGEEVTDWENTTYTVYGLPIALSSKAREYYNAGHTMGSNTALQKPVGGGAVAEFPAHPAFSFTADQKKGVFGNNCPILSFVLQDMDNEGNRIFWYLPEYIGRYGEVRESDMAGLDISISADGEEIYSGGSLSNWSIERSMDGHTPGKVTAVFENRNVRVDDLPGYNLATVEYDESLSDPFPPSLQMLLFKDADGNVTDRFDKSEDGVFEFAGGDFNWTRNETGNWYECGVADVSVEYAPYGSSDYRSLECEEMPELFFMPGFGPFYQGSLSTVDRKAPYGWYDLRIVLEDEVGNRQTQTISPAFCITSLSGIENVDSESTSSSEEIFYNLQGMPVKQLSRGLYIRVFDGRVEKIIR